MKTIELNDRQIEILKTGLDMQITELNVELMECESTFSNGQLNERPYKAWKNAIQTMIDEKMEMFSTLNQ